MAINVTVFLNLNFGPHVLAPHGIASRPSRPSGDAL